jgi:hypothetical protein
MKNKFKRNNYKLTKTNKTAKAANGTLQNVEISGDNNTM